MKGDRTITRIRVKEVINPIDLLVEIVTTGEIVNTTVLNVKQIRKEHVLPRVSSMKCKLFDVLVSEEQQRIAQRMLRRFVEEKIAIVEVKQLSGNDYLAEMEVSGESVNNAITYLCC
jgi:hypothetical protein